MTDSELVFDFSSVSVLDFQHLCNTSNSSWDVIVALEIIDRCVVGGITHLPADLIPMIVTDFYTAFNQYMSESLADWRPDGSTQD